MPRKSRPTEHYAGTYFEAYGVPDPSTGDTAWADAGLDLDAYFAETGYPPEHLVEAERKRMDRRLPSIEGDLFA